MNQHLGYGKRLIQKAESISSEKGFSKIAVIAGVGVRNYYRKLGYLDDSGQGNFQIKSLPKVNYFEQNVEDTLEEATNTPVQQVEEVAEVAELAEITKCSQNIIIPAICILIPFVYSYFIGQRI